LASVNNAGAALKSTVRTAGLQNIYFDGASLVDLPCRLKVGIPFHYTMYGLLVGSALVAAASALAIAPRQINDTSCPGYSASNVANSGTGLSADLSLAGSPCNSYGKDIENLRLTVSYDTCLYIQVYTILIRH
jgi:hypothetical protein